MKIIVFDDDPTGSQTVHGCPLLLRWDKETLIKGLNNSSPLLFLLTNSRSLSPEMAEIRIREICKILKELISDLGLKNKDFLFVSRGDSTLRGHGVLEPEVINQELGPFNATFHIPAFFEGARITIDGIHLLNNIPVHKTIFAKDKIFGYSTSNLALWLEEKSNSKIKAGNITSISLEDLNNAHRHEKDMKNFVNLLSNLKDNRIVTVDATSKIHLDTFVKAIKELSDSKRFLFRSAASLINSLAEISTESNKIKDLSSLIIKESSGKNKPGLILVGSHVKLADQQLEVILNQKSCIGIEIDLNEIMPIFEKDKSEKFLIEFENKLLSEMIYILNANKTLVLYTTRGELSFQSNINRIEFGIFLAELMARLAGRCSNKLGYIISKGGITTNTLLSEGLKLSLVNLKGQVLPGLSVVCPEEVSIALPIITFPGNLGNKDTLLDVWNIMEGY